MKKDILISVYDMEIGGIERSLITMLENFDYESYNVDLLIYEHRGDLITQIPEEVHVLPQINAFSIFRKSIKQCLKEGHIGLAITRILSKYLAEFKSRKKNLIEGSGYIQMQLAQKFAIIFLPIIKKEYDVAISYAWPHDIIANKVKAKKKIAWIHTDYSKLEVDTKIDLKTWSSFDYIASISEEVTSSFLSTYPSLEHKIFLMENINSPSFINKLADEDVSFKHSSSETFKIVSVGRLSYAKGFDIAIEALKILHDKGYPNIKWYVVGYGPEDMNLSSKIKVNGLEQSFILLGKKSNPYPYISGADLYVQPSRYEGKAVTVTEAKILGKPILITDYSTSKSQINHLSDGVITDLSVEGLVNGVELFLSNDQLREHLTQTCQSTDYNNKRELENLYTVINDKEVNRKKQTTMSL